MFNLFFIKKHKKRILDYLDAIFVPTKKFKSPDRQYALTLDDVSPKCSKEHDCIDADSSSKKTYGDRDNSDRSFEDKPKILYSDRGPMIDSFDPQRVADAMRSHLQESTSTVSLMSSANISFVNKVEQHIQNKGLESAKVYKAAHMDRRLFSKMICNRDYQPSKDTVLALVFSLKLNLDEAKDLLERAGYSLSHSIRRDIIIEYFIKEGVYNLNNINAFLYNMNEKIIGKG